MIQTKLSDLFDYMPKSKIKAGDGLENGAYALYTSSENQTKYFDEYQHEPECLIFGTGGKASVHLAKRKFSTSTDCIVIRPKVEVKINAEYVFHYLKSNMQVLEDGFKGAGLKHISKAYLSKVEIPHPEDLNDQIRIAHLLGKVEALIAQRKEHLQQLDDLIKSVFLEMFGDPIRNEREWTTESLGALARIERGRFSPRPRNDPKYYGGNHPFIQTGDITRSNGRLKQYTQTLNDLGTKVSKEFEIDTIVIAIVGATIGETAILEIPTYAPDSVIGITPHTANHLNSVFIEYVLRFWKPILKARAPEAARANINIETLRPLKIIIPPERYKFSEIMLKLEKLKFSFQESCNALEALYGVLSQKAFKGELDLSRVPVPIKISEVAQEENSDLVIENPAELEFEFPVPSDPAFLQSAEGRNALIDEWLTIWLRRPGAFSAQNFSEAVRQRLSDLTDGEAPDWGIREYDELKVLIFEALEQGRFTQDYDDENNRVRVTAAKG